MVLPDRASNDGSTPAGHVVGKADSRREVIQVQREEPLRNTVVPRPCQTDRRIWKAAGLVARQERPPGVSMNFFGMARKLITEPSSHRQVKSQSPFVFDEQVVRAELVSRLRVSGY